MSFRTSLNTKAMKISAHIPEDQWHLIQPHIDCDQWHNPITEEYIFYGASEKFLVILALHDINYWRDHVDI